MADIKYPYLPEGREMKFVPLRNEWMQMAKKVTEEESACSWWPTGAVIVKDGKMIGTGSNSGNYQPLCPRVANNCPTGQGYELCKDICQQKGHSEPSAINDAKKNDQDTNGADLYLYGHWWCCESCWGSMISAGIKDVYLLEDAYEIFNREDRLTLMSQVERKIKIGQIVTKEDTRWKI